MKKTLGKTLEGPFTKLARAMSRNYGIDVIPSGFTCATDGLSKIWIPFHADDMKEVDQQVLHGFLDHEISHVVEEREALEARAAGRRVKTPNELMEAAKSNREKMMLNVFEDIRIEMKAARLYVGMAENLNRANKHSVDAFRRRHGGKDGAANFWHTLGSAIILQARGEDVSWAPVTVLPYLALVQEEIADSKRTTRVEESHALALRVLEKIKAKADKDAGEAGEEKKERARERDEKEKAEKAKAERAEAGEEGDDEAEPGAPGEDDEEGDGEPAPSTPGDDGEEAEAGEGGATGDEGAPSDEAPARPLGGKSDDELDAMKAAADATKADAETKDMADFAKKEMEKRAREDAREHRRYVPHPDALARDRWQVVKARDDVYGYLRDTVNSQVHALRAKLYAILRARKDSHYVGDRERGQLDAASLYSVRLGNKRVFSEKTKAEEINTAVTIVLDQSGSMGSDGKIECAQKMAIALGETFAALGIPFEVFGFHNTPAGAASPSPDYSRTFPFDYMVYKTFNEPYRQVRGRLGGVGVGSENVDGEAVIAFARRLAARPEARKLMFVLSDGAPCGGCPHAAAVQHLKDAVEMVSNSGIRVFGIGAMTADVERFYPNHIVVNDIDHLAVKVYKLMRSELLSPKRGAA